MGWDKTRACLLGLGLGLETPGFEAVRVKIGKIFVTFYFILQKVGKKVTT